MIPTLLRFTAAACLWALPISASTERAVAEDPSPLNRETFARETISKPDPAGSFLAPSPRTIRLGQDLTAWRRSADSLRELGFRPISIDAETVPVNSPILANERARTLFATVWARKPGPAWALAGPVAGSEFAVELARWRSKGYRPYAVVAAAPSSFAALLVKDGLNAYVRFDLDPEGFQAACDSARKERSKCEWIEAYGDPGRPRFAAVFARDTDATPWNYSLGDDTASLRAKREIFARVWVRPAHVATMPGGRFATVWEENSAGAQELYPELDAAGISAACGPVESRSAVGGSAESGRDEAPRPVSIRIWPGSPGKYALSEAERDAPLRREWTVNGPEAPGLEAFDAYMRNLMRARGVRAGTLAIAREGRLVFAHGYTWAEPGYPLTRPNSLFRAASCSKPLTSILVHKMLREGEGRDEAPSLKEKILSLLHGGKETPDAPADPRFGDITVDELLTHSAGWIRSRNHPDPVFNDYPPGSDIRKRLPADRAGFLSYMLRQPLQFAPGSRSVYDNFGYFLLGRMLESLPMGTGRTYRDIAGDLLFKPLGLSRPRFGGSRMEERAPDEVLYHTDIPYLQANPAAGGAPWVAGGYGDFEVGNMDAAGAWLLSAPDYAKVLAAFDLDAGNPILGPQATATMWGPSPFGEALRGWFALKIPSGKKDTAIAKWHNGLFPGTSTLVFYHPEKWSFVMFLNRDLSPQPDGPHEGRDLAGLAARIESWPQGDLFPAMGIPAFRQPTIGPPSVLAGDPK